MPAKKTIDPVVHVLLDRQLLIEELYRLRGLIPAEADEARELADRLVDAIMESPIEETAGSSYPRINTRRR